MQRALSFFLAAFVSAAMAFAQPAQALASLEGRVTDAAGAPLRKTALTLRAYGGVQAQTLYSATTDSAGRYSFDAIDPGTYTLSAERAGFLPKMYRGSPHETMSQITLTAGQHLEINLALTRAATISGSVLDSDGDPVAGIAVNLVRPGYQNGRLGLVLQGSAFSNESGKYQIGILASGESYLMAGMRGDPVFSVVGMKAVSSYSTNPRAKSAQLPEYYSATFYPGATAESAAKPLKVMTGADMPGMDIHLQKTPAFRVEGKVAGATGGPPVEQCRVMLTSAERPESFSGLRNEGPPARLGKDGTFDFPGLLFAPGVYHLNVSCSPVMGPVLARQRVVIGDQGLNNIVLNLLPLLELRGAVTIEGDQQQDFSQPRNSGVPPGAATPRVALYARAGPMLSDLITKVNDDGSFLIPNIAPGIYNVRLYNIPSGTYLKSVKLGSGEARDSGIDISDVTARSPLQIMLSRSVGRIEGIVQTDAGKPAPDSTVTLVENPPGTGPGMAMMSGVGDNGRFSLSPVPPGTYRLYAWEDLEVAQHYDPELLKPYIGKSIEITVSENGTAQVVLTQIPAAPGYQSK